MRSECPWATCAFERRIHSSCTHPRARSGRHGAPLHRAGARADRTRIVSCGPPAERTCSETRGWSESETAVLGPTEGRRRVLGRDWLLETEWFATRGTRPEVWLRACGRKPETAHVAADFARGAA